MLHQCFSYFHIQTAIDCGFEQVSVAGDGDCCLTSVSLGLNQLLQGNDETLIQHLESLQVHREHYTERVGSGRMAWGQ